MCTWKSAKSWEAIYLATEGIENEIKLDPVTGKMLLNKSKGSLNQENINHPEDLRRDSQNVPLSKTLGVLQTPPSLIPKNVFPVLCNSDVDVLDGSQILPCSLIPANESPNFINKWLEKSSSTMVQSSNLNPKKGTNKCIIPNSTGSVPSHKTILLSSKKKGKSIEIENIINFVKLSGESSRGRPVQKNVRRKLDFDNYSHSNLSSHSMFSKKSCEKFTKQEVKNINDSTKKKMGYSGWYESIYIWFRFFITQPILNVTKQLYLYGPPAVGKSQAILEIIGDININYCFFASTGRYAFDGLDVKQHRIVIFEQFELRHWKTDLGNLNQFLCGQFFTINRKWKSSIKARFPGMVVIITRDGRVVDKGLDARLYQVHASNPYTAEEIISYDYIP